MNKTNYDEQDSRILNTAPTSVYLILTENCNLRCTYCFEKNSRTVQNYMTEDIAFRSVDIILENTLKKANIFNKKGIPNKIKPASITFFGGEPALCPELMSKILHYSWEKAAEMEIPIEYSIITNGTLFTDEYEKFLAEWAELTNGALSVQLSIDGIPEIQNVNRPCALATQKSSDLVEATVEKYHEFFSEHNIDPERLTIHACVSKQSIGNIFDSFKYFYNTLKIINSRFAWVIEDDWDDQDVETLDNEMAKLIRWLCERTTNQKRFPFKTFDKCSGCSSGKNLFCVDTSGNVFPCHRFFFFDRLNKELSFGNVLDDNFDINNCDKREPFTSFDISKISDVCQICIATNYEYTGSLYERPNHYDAKFMEVLNAWKDVFNENCEKRYLAQTVVSLNNRVAQLEKLLIEKRIIEDSNIKKNCNCNGECKGDSCNCKNK